MIIKKDIEPYILWKVNEGNISFSWDNWAGIGPLGSYIQRDKKPGNMKLMKCIRDNIWDEDALSRLVPLNLLDHIRKIPIGDRLLRDIPIWIPTSTSVFSCSSAFNCLRMKKEILPLWKDIWKGHIPFKMSFILWRAVKGKLPVDETKKIWKEHGVQMLVL